MVTWYGFVTLVHQISVSSWSLPEPLLRHTSRWSRSTIKSAPGTTNRIDVCNFTLFACKCGSLSLSLVASFLIRFFLHNPMFSHTSRLSDHPKWVYQLSRTEPFHSAQSTPCSEPPLWLRPHWSSAITRLPCSSTECTGDLPFQELAQGPFHVQSFPYPFSLIHTASVCGVFFPLPNPLSFPFPFIISMFFLRHSATRCPCCPQLKQCP